MRWGVAVLSLALTITVWAQQAPPLVEFEAYAQRALSAEWNATLATIQADPLASELRIGYSAPAAVLEAQALSISIPGVASDPIVFTVNIEHDAHGLASLYSRDEWSESSVSLVVDGMDVLGDIRVGDALYKLTPLGGGMTAVYRYDTSQLRRHPENWEEFMRRQVPDAPPREDTETPGAERDTGDVIDVMVVYTQAARVGAGNIDAFIRFAIDNTHRAYRNTAIRPRLRLVHKHETSYTQHSDMEVDLMRLTSGHMDEVHALRDRHGADLVVLIVARHTEGPCGIAWQPPYQEYPDLNFYDWGFSVIAQNCELSDYYILAHEIGHNQGAGHDPDNTDTDFSYSFPYAHGLCNTNQNWNTVMAYESDSQGRCTPEIPYFSSPFVRYKGVPTGDAQVRDNRRVLNETAYRVANFLQSQPRFLHHTLPLVLAYSTTSGRQGFVLVRNASSVDGEVEIRAIDDMGERFGPVTMEIAAGRTGFFNSTDLELGNADKGLSGGIGNGTGHWRLTLETTLDIEPRAYVRTTEGFVTSMHQRALESESGRYVVPFFNAGSNTQVRSLLRVANPNDVTANVTIDAWDFAGQPGDTSVEFSLGPQAAVLISSQQLETGDGSLFSGRLGDGYGKWRFEVSAGNDLPLHIMGLLMTNTGHLTNTSR